MGRGVVLGVSRRLSAWWLGNYRAVTQARGRIPIETYTAVGYYLNSGMGVLECIINFNSSVCAQADIMVRISTDGGKSL